MTLPVLLTPEAEGQITAIEEWWTLNRPAAPTLFLDELEQCLTLLADSPTAGKRYGRKAAVPAIRRLLLRRSRYHVYYSADDQAVVILAVWHSSRGQQPPL